jgi:hypothetical protein
MQVIGRIYKIISDETDYVYIGSTTHQLNKRFANHKSAYNAYLNNKGNYITSFEICKYIDAEIELIHEGLFDSKKDMEKLEGEIIRTTPNAINKCTPGLTLCESYKKYRDQNKEVISVKSKQYREQNKEVILAKKRQYREQNKEVIQERSKQYREQKKQNAMRNASDPETDI